MAVVKYLESILGDTSPQEIRLDRASLEIATIQFPGLEVEPWLQRLNELAADLGDRLRNFNDGRDFVETAQRFLFIELGFHGNEEDYFDPLNSCLNHVLERRTGIPVTLSVMYMEIARRLAMPVFGIGLPRHFVIQFDDGNYATYIDPFHGGRTITPQECFALAGARVADPMLLRRVSKREIVRRMVQNLHSGYLKKSDWTRAAQTLDLLILAAPNGSHELAAALKLRGLLRIELKRFQDARIDFEQYLALEPEASDRAEVEQQIVNVHRWLARNN
jgi:regulator of sirC expression with transglutaminase-like and TPR domain